jgi:hypothetical protein
LANGQYALGGYFLLLVVIPVQAFNPQTIGHFGFYQGLSAVFLAVFPIGNHFD